MNFRPLVVTVAQLTILLAGPLLADDASSRTVRVEPVRLAAEAIPVEAIGVIVRKDEVGLGFLVDGLVESVLVRSGDIVTQGQVLASLKLDEVDSQWERARAAFEQATRDRARKERLLREKVIGEVEFQDADTLLDQAAAALKAAEFARKHSVIVAPSDGRILRRSVEPNQLVAAGNPVIGFASDREGWLLKVALASRDVVKVRAGNTATWSVAMGGTQSWDAVVSHVAEGSDVVTKTVDVELEPKSVPPDLRSGFVVHARIQPDEVSPRPRVPAIALTEGDRARASLFTLDKAGGVVHRVEVEVDAVRGDVAYLRTQLPEGTLVVTRGSELLRDGEAVRIETGATP